MNVKVLQRFKDEGVVREALNRLGITVELSALTRKDYCDGLIDTLIGLLQSVSDPIMKLEIVKALSGPYEPAYERVEKVLIGEYLKYAASHDLPGMDSLAWGIGNCLEIIVKPASENIASYMSIVGNKAFGSSRQMIVLVLSKFDKSKVEDTLIKLLDDPAVAGHAVMALGKIRSTKSLPSLMRFESCNNSWIRREAKKSIRKISGVS